MRENLIKVKGDPYNSWCLVYWNKKLEIPFIFTLRTSNDERAIKRAAKIEAKENRRAMSNFARKASPHAKQAALLKKAARDLEKYNKRKLEESRSI